jgi:hypothetical protein
VTSPTRGHALGAVLISIVSVVPARAARAQEPLVLALDYATAPDLADCPSADEFRRQVTRQLGRDPFGEAASRRLIVRIYDTAGKMGGKIEWRDAHDEWEGERTFSSRAGSCAAMGRTMSLATAIQIDLLASLGARADEEPEVLEEEEQAQPPPVPVEAVIQRAAVVAPPPREPWFGLALGVGLIHDFGGAPTAGLPRVAVSFGHPQVIAVRLAASGFGPPNHVSGLEGTAELERFVATLDVVRSFRHGRRVQPLASAGIGLQDLRVRGTSDMPALAAARNGQGLSALATAGVGVAFAFTRRLLFVLEGDALFFTPAVTVKVGSAVAAYLDGASLFLHGGLLARF